MNPIVNGIRYCGVVHGEEPKVFALDLGKFPTHSEAKAAVKSYLDTKRKLQQEAS